MKKEKESKMETTYLIQRLEKPFVVKSDHPFFGKDNPFAFGGGLENGGLSKEAMDLLRGIWAWDYMGAAEFEFGAVPKALSKMANMAVNHKLIAFTLDPNDWKISTDKFIYVICNGDDKEEVSSRIKSIAKDGYKFSLKEYTRLDDALGKPRDPRYPCRIFGWLELDNGFLFFVDKDMFKKTCQLFEVQHDM